MEYKEENFKASVCFKKKVNLFWDVETVCFIRISTNDTTKHILNNGHLYQTWLFSVQVFVYFVMYFWAWVCFPLFGLKLVLFNNTKTYLLRSNVSAGIHLRGKNCHRLFAEKWDHEKDQTLEKFSVSVVTTIVMKSIDTSVHTEARTPITWAEIINYFEIANMCHLMKNCIFNILFRDSLLFAVHFFHL